MKQRKDHFIHFLSSINERIIGDRFFDTVLIMTLLVILLFMDHTQILTGIIYLLIPVALLLGFVRRSAIYWSLLSFFIIVGFIPLLLTADNHIYLTVYWILAIALSMFVAKPIKSISFNARILIGLCFAFATLWKLLSPEFLDGTFFYFTFLTDDRFFRFAEIMGGISSEMRGLNLEVYESLKNSTNRMESGSFQGSSRLVNIAVFMAYWTVFIEGLIAISFLIPERFNFSKWRDLPLLIFMLTTYPIATVRGFAMLLTVMGFAQSTNHNMNMRVIYLLMFLAIPLFSLPFGDVILGIMNYFGIGF